MTSNERILLWQRRLAEQKASGLSIAAWCLQQQVGEQSFYLWRKRQAEGSLPFPSSSPQWLALNALHSPSAHLTLRVGAVSIDVAADFDPQLLSAVIRAITGEGGKSPC